MLTWSGMQNNFCVFIRCLAVGLSVVGMTAALASKPDNITKGEIALLPPYCIDTMGFGYGDAHSNTSPRAGHWIGMMGKSFWAVHHYCWGLIDQQRAQFISTRSPIRTGTLERAIGNYQYTIRNATPDFVLLPEIYTKMGEAELMLSRLGPAYDAFQRAREIKPDYWPAYSKWTEVLIRSGQKADAKKLVKTGLEYSPDAKVLLDQYRALGGDPAEIVPRVKKTAPEAVPGDAVGVTSEAVPAK